MIFWKHQVFTMSILIKMQVQCPRTKRSILFFCKYFSRMKILDFFRFQSSIGSNSWGDTSGKLQSISTKNCKKVLKKGVHCEIFQTLQIVTQFLRSNMLLCTNWLNKFCICAASRQIKFRNFELWKSRSKTLIMTMIICKHSVIEFCHDNILNLLLTCKQCTYLFWLSKFLCVLHAFSLKNRPKKALTKQRC